ncbi:MAG: winged helix-turn-helix transcriptional regulator [Thaumarchaeota archaeon]|nr:winged helix-turn-helix transcriptional regulator [Nitrososphaerota archaeon]
MALVCYHGETPHKINQDRADVILKIILDKERRKIIFCISNESKTQSQISKETGLSISSVYRRIHDLNEKELLILSGNINLHGRREFRYKSKIRKVVIVFDKDVTDVKVYSNLRE